MNFSGSVGRINLILFALDSVNQAASFDYNKPIIKDTLNFDLKGGTGFFPRAVAMWVLTLEVRSLCFSNVLCPITLMEWVKPSYLIHGKFWATLRSQSILLSDFFAVYAKNQYIPAF